MNRSERCPMIFAEHLLFICAVVLCFICALTFAQAPSSPQLSDDESAAYIALFQDLYNPTKDHPLVLIDSTSRGVPPGLVSKVDVRGEQTSRFLSRLSPETKQDWDDRNKDHIILPSPCHLAPDCIVYDVAGIAPLVKDEHAWRGFMKKHANSLGVVVVSRIGFNRDHTEAIVYVGRACGTICGEGEFARLIKSNGAWTVDDHTVVWLSQK
jgi:hypothetical protein